MKPGLTRIAPTPSGFLHLGNVLHFIIVEQWASELGLDIHLRIDDFDVARVQERYIEDIFRVLDELEISWQSGPRRSNEVVESLAPGSAWHELQLATDRGLAIFPCQCTRRSRSLGNGCDCRLRAVSYRPGATSIRLDGVALGLPTSMDGAVLWRRDDLPGYHLASILLDRNAGITHIMRGEDLRPATQLQVAIAPYFAAFNVQQAQVRHHQLLHDDNGNKLSKSAGAHSGPLALSDRETLLRQAALLLPGDR